MRTLVSNGIVLFAGLIAVPCGIEDTLKAYKEVSYQQDPRLVRLKDYFQEMESPLSPYAADFIAAADRHALDWRLLPSISVIETSAGKTRPKSNNVFGWANGRHKFNTVRTGIHTVASRLSKGRPYRNKNVDAKLRAYNTLPGYPERVKRVMKQLGPEVLN